MKPLEISQINSDETAKMGVENPFCADAEAEIQSTIFP